MSPLGPLATALALLLWLLPSLSQAQPAPQASQALIPITSDPEGAVVMRDGRLLCRSTPCQRMLKPGVHTLEMLLEGHSPLRRTLRLDHGDRISWRMVSDGAQLTLELPQGQQASLQIVLDGQALDGDPERPLSLTPGAHKIQIQSPCYLSLEHSLTLERDQRLSWAPPLQARQGHLRVVSQGEEPLEIWAGDQKLGTTPATISASVCTHQLELRQGEDRYLVLPQLQEGAVGLLRVPQRDALLEGQSVHVAPHTLALGEGSACRATPGSQEQRSALLAAGQPVPQEVTTVLGLRSGCGRDRELVALIQQEGDTFFVPASALSTEPHSQNTSQAQVARITQAGALYSTINRGDCLTWPDEEIQALGGQNAWGGYYPKNGDQGVVVWTTTHCSSKLKVYLLRIGEHYVPIGEPGVELLGSQAAQPAPPAAAPLRVGLQARVTHPGYHYDRLHKRQCIDWPAPRGAASAGSDAPPRGAIGHLVARQIHCQSGATVYLLEWRGHIYPFAPEGLEGVAP